MKNLFSALKQNAFTPSQNFVKMSISLEAKTYSSHIFSQKENSTQSPERMDGRLLCKTNALNKSGSHSAQEPVFQGIYIISFRILNFLRARHSFYSPQPVLKHC